jgi:hypothetical protein
MQTYRLNKKGFPVGCEHSVDFSITKILLISLFSLVVFIQASSSYYSEVIGALLAATLALVLYAINKKTWLMRDIDGEDISKLSYLLAKLPPGVCMPENMALEQMTNRDLSTMIATLNDKLIKLNKEYEIQNCDVLIKDIAKC